MKIHEIRLENLHRLVSEFGSVADLAALADVTDRYLTDIIERNTYPSGTVKNVGNALARKLELACGKASGWMDERHDPTQKRRSEDIVLSAEEQILLVKFRRAPLDIRRIIMFAASCVD